MKPPFLLPLASAALLLACGQENAGTAMNDAGPGINGLQDRVATITGKAYTAPGEADARGEARPQRPVQEKGGLRTITIPSKDFNVPLAQLALPARWNVKTAASGAWYVDGPGLTVHDVAGGSFMYGGGQMAQFYQQAGGQVRAPLAPEQVVAQDLVPRMRQAGYELIGQGHAPAVAQANQRGLDGLYSIGQQRKTCRANISEWRKGGQRVALVMHWSSFESPGLVQWSYYLTQLETTASQFEQEKDALLAGLAGTQYNPAYFAAYAQSEQQKANGSWAAHNQRMKSNQAAFDAQQRTHRETWDAINNASMGAYQDRMNSMDRQQNATINTIRGEQDAVNPYTGQGYKVESGYDRYWMNSDGQYIGTNDVMYDPNINSDRADQWRQVPANP